MENMTLTDNQVSKKSKLVTWIATILLGGVIALGTFLSTLTPKYKSLGAVSYNDDEYYITLTADELNNNTFSHLCSYLDNSDSDYLNSIGLQFVYVTYDEDNFVYDDFVHDDALTFFNNDFNSFIGLDFNSFHFSYTYEGVTTSFNTSLYIYFDEIADTTLYNAFAQNIQKDLFVPNPQDWLTEIISLLTGGIVGISSGIGTGVSSLVGDIFINNGALSFFGATIVIFASISLALGLCRFVINYLTSLGAKK